LIRWRDVLLYALVGAGAAGVVAARLEQFSGPLGANDTVGAAVVLLSMALISIVLLHKIAGTRLGHIRHVLRYPPLPIAVVLGIFFVGVRDAAVNKQADWRAIAALELLYCAIWAAHVLTRATWDWLARRAISDPRAASASDVQQTDKQLLAWIERESPISDSASDLFAHQIIAERLLRRLSQGETTIALQGAFGSGKSSIGRLAASRARASRLPLVFAEVSCWGFGESLDAQEELLTQVIRRVSQHVDTFALRNLPAEYVGSMGSHLGLYGTVLRIINGKRSPERVLQQLSPILSIIRKRVVLFIEDADRNFATFDMTRLESLLMRLREIPGLSFVLCISRTQKIDVNRLCERTEIVPELDQGATLRLIERTRDLLLRKHPVGVMLDRLDGLVAGEGDFAMLEGALGYYWPRQYILPALAGSPRTLKRILRRVIEAWPDLCGEVTIDDLINISVLREGAPEAFEFFRQNHRFFRTALKEHDVTEVAKTKIKESLSEEWQLIIASRTFDARSAAWLMKDIFPSSAGITGLFASHTVRHQSMQSERRGEIYARRLISETAFGDEISDQRMFELLSKAQSEDAMLSELAHAITDSNFASDAFEEFAHALEFDRFLPLLSQVYRIIRERHGPRLSREDHPGFFAPWRLIMYEKPNGFEQWLAAELRLCIPKHLRLMTDIYYFFVGADRHTFAEREPSRRAIHSALKESWTSILPVQIAEGFDASYPYTLFHLIFTSDYEKPETVPLGQIENWAWSGPPLAAAAQAAPSVMLPQIINAVNLTSNRGREVPRFTLDETLFHTWFGDDGAIILSLIRRGFDPPDDLDPQVRYLVAQAFEQVRA
jgi:hypothetical protein